MIASESELNDSRDGSLSLRVSGRLVRAEGTGPSNPIGGKNENSD